MSDLLVIDGLSKRFGGLWAVRDCSFTVPTGGLVGLIGPNGAGKSTLFDMISGIQTSDSGRILLDGEDLAGRTADEIARADIGRTFQAPRAFLSLTVIENVVASAPSPGDRLWNALTGRYRAAERELEARALTLLDLVGLRPRAQDPAAELSGGELRMLEVVRHLIRRPRLLLLDEPTAGVSPDLQTHLARVLRQLHSEGTTLLIVEHNLTFLLSLAEHIVVLDHGAVLAQGTPTEIRRNESVISAYLGRAHAS